MRPDRLSALVSRFEMHVGAEPAGAANLVIGGDAAAGTVSHVVFHPGARPLVDPPLSGETLFRALAHWGGKTNPLVSALPERIEFAVAPGDEIEGLANLLASESRERRCGSGAVIDRLGEVLVVRLLRELLRAGTTEVGLLAGLADPRLSPAIVAMHDRPDEAWRVERLAEVAGLSGSRFSERFARTVGTTPMSYLRHWRLVLARQDVERGERIQAIAARYGYGSTEALTRAFKRVHGEKPTAFRSG